MDKNLFTAVGLSLLVYALWFGFIEKRYVKPAAPAAAKTQVPSQPASSAMDRAAPSIDQGRGQPSAMKPSAPEAAAPKKEDRQVLEAESASLDLGKTTLAINPRGAAVVSARYHDLLGAVELIPQAQPGYFSAFPELAFKLEHADRESVVYTATRPDGVLIRKEFKTSGDSALPRLVITLSNPASKPARTGDWSLSWGPGLGTVKSEEGENEKVSRAIGLTQGQGMSLGKIEEFKPGERPAAFRWVAVDNRYFLAAAAPAPGQFETVESRTPPALELKAKSVELGPGSSRVWDVPFYLGAKGHTWLTRYNAGLERSIDFGFFAQVGRFILSMLNRIHGVIGNWGWSIIILTVALQIVLFPLTYKSLKAAAMMKRLQPEIAKLQQRYSKDPGRLNAETMELYKKTGANPLGGCLPMLLQMPIFIALFNTLRNAWELHGAPWMFWVHDLSAKDPFYVLPVVMGGLMFLQNKLNPPTTDPTQAQMMTFMPIIFTVMFLNFPSGLVLYWLTNSVMSALQQAALKGHFEKNA